MFLVASFFAACFAGGASCVDQDGEPVSAEGTIVGTAALAALGVSHFFL